MNWYWNLSSLLLKENGRNNELSGGLRHELQGRIVSLYKTILSYQMMSVCSYHRNRGLEFVRSLLQLDNWDGTLTRVHEAEAAVRQDSAEYNTQQVLSHLEQLVSVATSLEAKLLGRYGPTEPRSAPAPAPAPTRHWIVPFGRNDDFIGREAALSLLLEKIPPSAKRDRCQRTAVEGLGGIGKTQIALEAAFQVRDRYPDCSVFWVPTVDATSFENAYRKIGQTLGIEGVGDSNADVKMLVKTALSRDDVGSWLLIIDNADDQELLLGAADATGLYHYLPSNMNGSILFTTRYHRLAVDLAGNNVLTLEKFGRSEALSLLKGSLQEYQLSNEDSTTELLDRLADLPLAIRQASAYMAKETVTTEQYLSYCQSSDEELIDLLSLEFEDEHRYKSIKNPVATTWLVSFQHIARHNPLAANYLKFMCLLSEKDIPESILPAAGKREKAEAIATLKAYAFISERQSGSFDIHRLVPSAMRRYLDIKGKKQQTYHDAVRQLREAYPSPRFQNRELWITYLAHAQAVVARRWITTADVDETVVLARIAKSHRLLGNYEKSEQMYIQVMEASKRCRGPEHRRTLVYMRSYADVLYDREKYDDAEQVYRQVVEIQTRKLGPNDRSTLDTMSNLGATLASLDKLTEAEAIHRQVLEKRQAAFGMDAEVTLDSANNLATVLEWQGKVEESEGIYRHGLEKMQNIKGLEYPNTIASMYNLGTNLVRQERYAESEKLLQQAVELSQRMFAHTHPDTLTYMEMLASVLLRQGKTDEADRLQRRMAELEGK